MEVEINLNREAFSRKKIADALKIKNRNDGYFEENGYIITWAFGHLLQLYDAKMTGWNIENFPFIPSGFR